MSEDLTLTPPLQENTRSPLPGDHKAKNHQQVLTLQHITTMLNLQERINSQISSDWRVAQNPWYRAMWVEAAEMLDHHGWKWWKKQDISWDQVHMEIVDIWHFGLSDSLQHSHDSNLTIDALYRFIVLPLSKNKPQESLQTNQPNNFLETIETFALECLSLKRFPLARFSELLIKSGLSFEQLTRFYIGKNCLNRFRQINGYKQGTYQKIWNGAEDNEHLAKILNTIPQDADNLEQRIDQALAAAYPY